MKPMTFEETRQVELEILTDVVNFCDKNGIHYYLAYGTLIGAVRHKGFIPWDDDIDIWMPRKDYNKFQKTYNKENPSGRYRVVTPYDKVSRYTFLKVIDTKTIKIESNVNYSNGNLGVDIDIFPLDGQPTNQDKYLKWYNMLQKHYKLFPYHILNAPISLKRKIIYQFLKLISGGRNRILKKTAALHSLYSYDSSEYVGSVESCYNYDNDRYKKDWFSGSATVDFENKKFKIPNGYDEILTQLYGDYMQLPPEEKQVTHHLNKTYWNEE